MELVQAKGLTATDPSVQANRNVSSNQNPTSAVLVQPDVNSPLPNADPPTTLDASAEVLHLNVDHFLQPAAATMPLIQPIASTSQHPLVPPGSEQPSLSYSLVPMHQPVVTTKVLTGTLLRY